MALIMVIMITMILLTVTGAGLLFSGLNHRTASSYQKTSQVLYAAETGAESAAAQIITLFNTVLLPTPSNLATITPPTVSGYTFPAFTVAPVGGQVQQEIAAGVYAGLTAYITNYQITSTATQTGTTNSAAVVLEVQDYLIPLFQFGVFYQDDLEMLPGPNMTFTGGRIHSNNDIYVGANATFSIDAKMSTAQNVYNRRKDTGAAALMPGTVQIKDSLGGYQAMKQGGVVLDSGDPTLFPDPYVLDPLTEKNANWAGDSQTRWGGNVKSTDHGIQSLNLPLPATNSPVDIIQRGDAGDSQALKDARYYWTAGLRIIDGAAFDKNGVGVTLPAGALTSRTFWDYREQKTVEAHELDVNALGSAGTTWNGIVYISKTQSGGDLDAVRLVNGSSLPTGGLTVASDNPVYIKGNYNTANGPAAIIGDAVTILSSSWNDAWNAGTPLDSRIPTATTVKGAIMTGNVPTSGPDYSGGVENLPRFLEKWTGVTLTYSGSLVDLWSSQRATGDWKYGGSVYTAPNRNWSYGISLANMPPGTPRVRLVQKVRWKQLLN